MLRTWSLLLAVCFGLVIFANPVDASGGYKARIRYIHFSAPPEIERVDVEVNARCSYLWVTLSDRHGNELGVYEKLFVNGLAHYSLPMHPTMWYHVNIDCFVSSEGGDETIQDYLISYAQASYAQASVIVQRIQ